MPHLEAIMAQNRPIHTVIIMSMAHARATEPPDKVMVMGLLRKAMAARLVTVDNQAMATRAMVVTLHPRDTATRPPDRAMAAMLHLRDLATKLQELDTAAIKLPRDLATVATRLLRDLATVATKLLRDLATVDTRLLSSQAIRPLDKVMVRPDTVDMVPNGEECLHFRQDLYLS